MTARGGLPGHTRGIGKLRRGRGGWVVCDAVSEEKGSQIFWAEDKKQKSCFKNPKEKQKRMVHQDVPRITLTEGAMSGPQFGFRLTWQP